MGVANEVNFEEYGNDIPKKYRKKPVEIEAVQYTGGNLEQIKKFVDAQLISFDGDFITIHTLEGDMLASKNDYIIRGVQGEFYPCKPDIFEQTYEEVTTYN
jgi:hypothetical protein